MVVLWVLELQEAERRHLEKNKCEKQNLKKIKISHVILSQLRTGKGSEQRKVVRTLGRIITREHADLFLPWHLGTQL